MFRTVLLAGGLALALFNTASADVETNKAKTIEAIAKVFGEGNPDAVDAYFADPYIQHNPMIPSGVGPLKGLVAKVSEGPGIKAEVVRVIGEGNLVALHTRYEGFGPQPLIAFDVYRFNEDGMIVEHWDNLTPETPPNPSGRTQIDGATEITDLDKTADNKALVESFINDFIITHSETNITKFISPVTYIQHNSQVADGLEGFGAAMQAMKEQGVEMVYSKLHFTVAEGNFVLAASDGQFAGKDVAFYDLFRVEDGLIVEHWDVIADMPGENTPEGYPGKF